MSDHILKDVENVIADAQKATGQIDARYDAQFRIEGEKPKGILDRINSLSLAAGRINKVWDASQNLYNSVMLYVRPFIKPALWTAAKAKDAFLYSAFERDENGPKRDEDGDLKFSSKRLAKIFAFAAMTAGAVGLGAQATYFYGTQFSEMVYVTGKQEILPGELYQFTGCTSLPCSTEVDNGKYYQIEQGLFFPRLLYPEEDVFANIPTELSACQVHGHGIYFKELKFLFKWTEFYQNVHDVSCRPLSEQEIAQAMQIPSSQTLQPAP